MNSVLQPYLNEFVVVYLNDIVIFLNSDEDYIKHLALVLDRL